MGTVRTDDEIILPSRTRFTWISQWSWNASSFLGNRTSLSITGIGAVLCTRWWWCTAWCGCSKLQLFTQRKMGKKFRNTHVVTVIHRLYDVKQIGVLAKLVAVLLHCLWVSSHELHEYEKKPSLESMEQKLLNFFFRIFLVKKTLPCWATCPSLWMH